AGLVDRKQVVAGQGERAGERVGVDQDGVVGPAGSAAAGDRGVAGPGGDRNRVVGGVRGGNGGAAAAAVDQVGNEVGDGVIGGALQRQRGGGVKTGGDDREAAAGLAGRKQVVGGQG